MNFIAITFDVEDVENEDWLNPVSIGLVKFENGKLLDSFYGFINSHFDELWSSDLKYWLNEEFPLVIHNEKLWELIILENLLKKHSIKMPKLKYFDLLGIAQKTWNNFSDQQYFIYAKKFGLDYGKQDYLSDAKLRGELILLAAKEKGCKSIDELLAACGMEMKIFQ